MDFAWSLKPIFAWLTFILGVGLDRPHQRSSVKRCFLLVYAFVITSTSISLFAYNVATSISHGVEGNSPTFPDETVARSTMINMYVNKITGTVSGAFIQFCFAIGVHFKWKRLWERLAQIQQLIGHNPPFYRRLRHISIAAASILVLVKAWNGENIIVKI